MKRLLLFTILFIVISCGGGDDSPTVNTDPVGTNDPAGQGDDDPMEESTQTLKLNLDGITLNYDGLQLVSSDSESSLTDDQDIAVPNEQYELGLPIVFIQNDELLFGYYPNEGDAEITNDDILFFFFASFPSFDLLGIQREFLKTQLSNSSLKSNIMDEMVASLNQETDPFDNDAFTELFVQIANEIINEGSSSKFSKLDTAEFKIDYTREGKISWPNDVPLFATVGVEIIDLERSPNKPVSEDFLSPKKLQVVGAIADFFYNLPNYINNIEEVAPSFQIQEEGEYLIRFSNGNPFYYDDTEATEANYRLLITHALSIVFTADILKWGKGDECQASLYNFVRGNLYENFTRLWVGIDLNNDAAIETLYEEFLKDSFEEMKGAIGVCSGAKILGYTMKAVLKKLDLIFDWSNLILASRDFLISDVYEEQKVYYKNDFLVGEISEEVISPIDFTLIPNQEFSFEANYQETLVSYIFNRDGIASEVSPVFESKPAAFLPFKYEIFEGDVTSQNPTSYTGNSAGNFILDFTMGNENSIIFVDPEFLSPNVDTKTILANVCGSEEIQNILNILEGKIWCYTQPAGPACSTGPWTISGNNRVVATGFTGTSWDYYYDFYMDEECNEILIRGTSGYNGSVIISRLLIINESTFSYELLSNPGTIITWVPQ